MAHGGFWKVNKIAFNLLEDLLTLHVCLRSFSHTTDQQQDSNVKARSLRITEVAIRRDSSK